MRKSHFILWALIACAVGFALVSCGGGGGGSPTPPPVVQNPSVVVSTSAFGSNQTCPSGGINVQSGIDDNGNGVLDPAEVDVVQEVCNGSDGTDGANGTDGLDALIKVTPEPAGANCAFGGQRIDAGIDANGNAVLDAPEITSTEYVCNGLPTPIITGVNPEEVKTGQEIRITGAGFGATQGTSELTIGGASALPTDIISWGEYEIRAKVPVGASTGIVTVTVAGVQGSPGFFVLLWTDENPVNAAVCTASFNQSSAAIVSDGAGGAIITWEDYRGGNLYYDIYAQRVGASGIAQWTTDGVAVSTAVNHQYNPTIASDGAGGAIIAWQDYRSGNADIYAQRLDASGTAQWTTDGVAVSTATSDQLNPVIVPDGTGGAIITWQDYRGGADIYAQRVGASGNVQWTTDGVAVSTATNQQLNPVIAPDSAGGAIIAWQDNRSGNADIYAQQVDASGNPLWTANGVAVSTAASNQNSPLIVPDGAGGAIIAWLDYRSGTDFDIYARRVDASGNPLWTADGVAICTDPSSQEYPWIAPDGAGGAIIAWEDYRDLAVTGIDIYAQRVDSSGSVQWTVNGAAVSRAMNTQIAAHITPDGAGGAIIAWQDYRDSATTSIDIYVQRVNAWGNSLWTLDGVAISTAVEIQSAPVIATDGEGGAIIAWQDSRSGAGSDIYAQGISASGRQ